MKKNSSKSIQSQIMKGIITIVAFALIVASCCRNNSSKIPIVPIPEIDMSPPTLGPEDVGLVYNDTTGYWDYPE